MCGYGEKDRRPVDPPPVVELVAQDLDGKILRDPRIFSDPFTLCTVHLISAEDPAVDLTLGPMTSPHLGMKEESWSSQGGNGPSFAVARVLVGSYASELMCLEDLDGKCSGLFVFPDLSVRCEGKYRLFATAMMCGR
jgi:hypothetical protein